MYNDAIVLEFVNDDGAEVLLSPAFVPIVADAMRHAMAATYRNGMARQRRSPPVVDGETFSLFLVGAERGSLKLFFKAVWDTLGDDVASRRIGSVSDSLSAAGILGGAFVWAGVHLGLFAPLQDPRPQGHDPAHRLAEHAAQDAQTGVNIQRFVEAARSAGVDTVIIHTPGAPSCRIGGSTSEINASLIGSLAPPELTIRANAKERGALLLGDDTLVADVQIGGHTPQTGVTLYTGTIDLSMNRVPVLVIWKSKRPVPLGKKDRVHVSGDVMPIGMIDITPLEHVPMAARRAAGILIVESQTVEE